MGQDRDAGTGRVAEPMMLVTPSRIAYFGPIGRHEVRSLGAALIYVAHERPFTIMREGAADRVWAAVVPAHQVHRVISTDRYGAHLAIEPETIVEAECLRALSRLHQQDLRERILHGFGWAQRFGVAPARFDDVFLGGGLAQRSLDRRIRQVADDIARDPAGKHVAEVKLDQVGLSVSRFSHLFRSEIGSTFRRYCAWKRARATIPLLGNREKLVETALDAGYADSTHFSHSLRQFFGVCPRDLTSILAAGDFRMIDRSTGSPQ